MGIHHLVWPVSHLRPGIFKLNYTAHMGRESGKAMQLQFAEMVKEARKKVGLSQAKLGEKIGVVEYLCGSD